jgi:histidinol dehydrogenase
MRHKKTSRVEVETIEGVNCWQEKDRFKSRSLHSGGTAPLFSTVLMLAVPANMVVAKSYCTPPDKKEI